MKYYPVKVYSMFGILLVKTSKDVVSVLEVVVRTIFIWLVPIYKKISRYPASFFLLVVCLVIFGSAALIHHLEPDTFINYLNSLYWTMTTITTVGYGDLAPQSPEGRMFAMILMVFGVLVHSMIVGKFLEFFSSFKRLKNEGKLRYVGMNHTVVVYYSEKSKRFIFKLLELDKNAEVVLIDVHDNSPIDHDRVHYIKGIASKKEILNKANVQNAKVVVIFSSPYEKDIEAADGKTLLIASMVEANYRNVHTLVEIVDEKHYEAFFHAGVNECIFSEDLTSKLAVMEALNPGKLKRIREMIEKEG